MYKPIELTGTSTKFINNAIKRAGKSVKNLHWFQVAETRSDIEKSCIHRWQVAMKVGFTVHQ